MSETAVIIDMDKTLVPSWKFMSDVAQALSEGFGIDKKRFYDDVNALHIVGNDNLRHYDFFTHIRKLGLDADETETYIVQYLKERDYVYDDVPHFLNFILSEVKPDFAAILTYGEHRFQHLKYKCAPTLSNLVCIDILEPKGRYIKNHFANYRGVIIDDKPIAALPRNFTGVLLERGTTNARGYSSLSVVQERWPEIVRAPSFGTTMPP
jgi:hypothetical protein